MRSLLLCIAVLFCTYGVKAQDIAWEQVPGPNDGIATFIGFGPANQLFVNARDGNAFSLQTSLDGGGTWEEVDISHSEWQIGYAVNYDSRGTIWLATESGLFSSDDRGRSWTKINTIPADQEPFRPQRVHITDNDIIFTQSWARRGDNRDGGALLRSTDYGVTWQAITDGLDPAESWRSVLSLAEDADGRLYAGILYHASVYRSDNGGESWAAIPIELDVGPGILDYVNIVGGMAVNSSGHVFAAGYQHGLFRSLDKGTTWEPVFAEGRHPAVTGLVINSQEHIFVSTQFEGGVYRSKDNGESWEHVGSGLSGGTSHGALHLGTGEHLYVSTHTGLYRSQQSTVLDNDNSSIVRGSVYFDDNADCMRNSDEEGMKNRVVRFEPGPYFAWTDTEGNFEIRLSPADYTASLVSREYYEQVCPANDESISLTIKNAGEEHEGIDFATEAIADIEDLHVSISGQQARPGFTVSYTIRYKNVGTVPFTGRLLFEHDAWFNFVGADPAPDSYSPNTAAWNLVELPVDEVGLIRLQLRMNEDAPVGEFVCSRVYSDNGAEPELLSEDSDKFCHEIRNAYDPNDISVSPEGRLGKFDTRLNYTVRFQNTGNAPATNVIVRDTLDAGLNIESIELGAASHDFSFSIAGSNVATWTFNNIELPDSNANEPESHGYFKYRIDRFTDLEDGTIIPNSAAIYFDYNDPIITNTVKNYISLKPTSVELEREQAKLRLYPNPVSDRLSIDAQDPIDGVVVLRDLTGRSVLEVMAAHSETLSIDVSQLSSGRYFLHVPGDGGTLVRPIEVKR